MLTTVVNEPYMLSVVMLSVFKLSVVMLSVVKLSVVMLSDVMLSVVAPPKSLCFKQQKIDQYIKLFSASPAGANVLNLFMAVSYKFS
jgi:hypothetical protein